MRGTTGNGSASGPKINEASIMQFFGEYLHAFEDTFAHRDSKDMPFALEVGFGHGGFGSNPDYTYNHTNWTTNEARTLEAEKEVFAKMSAWKSPTAIAKTFDQIEDTLKAFNRIPQSEASGATTEERQKGYSEKILMLQLALIKIGYENIDITQSGAQSFKTGDAANNRADFLRNKDKKLLDQKLYQGTILPR